MLKLYSNIVWILLLLVCSTRPEVAASTTSTTRKKKEEKKSKKKKTTMKLHEQYSNLCNGQPTLHSKHEAGLQWLLHTIGKTQISSTSSKTSTPQQEAACWMFRQQQPGNFLSFSWWEPQRFVLATIYYATKGPQWEYNDRWMTSNHVCSWYGVRCNWKKQIVELDLGYIEMEGLIPREISLLKHLRDLDLHGNDLQGVIPHKILAGNQQLQYLRLQMNGLFGAIHKEIFHMKHLKELYLFGNFFAGTIPGKELSTLKDLQIIDLYANQLSGTIPSELAKLPKLIYLDLHDNNLVGTVPKELCQHKKLQSLIADCYGPKPEVKCDCCTVCCQGLPDLKCVDTKTGQVIVNRTI